MRYTFPVADFLRIDKSHFDLAVQQAEASRNTGGIPIGAVLVDNVGKVLGSGHNERIQKRDPIAHGEIACLRNAGRLRSYRSTTLYTTLSPCPMCSGAILLFKIPRVVVGEAETFGGDLGFLDKQGVEVVLVNDNRCIEMMLKFQEENRATWLEDIGETQV